MEMISRISKGSKMDQIYLPKNRQGFSAGQYVVISLLKTKTKNQLQEKKQIFKPYFYNVKNLEPLKLSIIYQIFSIVESINPENIIITGSFLEKGFNFNDIDILIITEKKNINLKERIEDTIRIKTHVITIGKEALLTGLSRDPLYSLMLSKCISKKRFIFKVSREFDYKILDFQLLKSKTLIDNFNLLNGNEKYYLALNMLAILLFMQNKRLSKELVEKEIEKQFNVKIKDIKENLISKQFLQNYKKIYNKTFNIILNNLKNQENKQK